MESSTTADQHALREKDIEAEAEAALPPLGMSNKEEGLKSRNLSSDEEDVAKCLDWESDTDPGNPQNWPKGKKIFHTLIPALYGFVM